MDVHTFANLNSPPTLDKINLILLTEYYKQYLEPYKFEIYIEDHEVAVLKFNRDNFCHLIGVQKPVVAKFGKNSPQVSNYKGNKGYRGIIDGSITKQTLKQMNKGAYKDLGKRMVNFFYIHKLLENPSAVNYSVTVNNISSIDILIYNQLNNAYFHLGIIKKEGLNYYVPTTFLIEPITINSDGKKFIAPQTSLEVIQTLKFPS